MPRLPSSQLPAAVKAPARQPQPKPYAWSREWAWNEAGGMMQVPQICNRYILLLSFTSKKWAHDCMVHTQDPFNRVPQVACVGNLAQPLLAMHAWRSLWVIAKTTAACLRSPKLLLRNLR